MFLNYEFNVPFWIVFVSALIFVAQSSASIDISKKGPKVTEIVSFQVYLKPFRTTSTIIDRQ